MEGKYFILKFFSDLLEANRCADFVTCEMLCYRGRCGELVSYWHYVGVDKTTMAQSYFTACKRMEESKSLITSLCFCISNFCITEACENWLFMFTVVGHYDGLVTLPRVADVYEALGRFLRDLGLLTEVQDSKFFLPL